MLQLWSKQYELPWLIHTDMTLEPLAYAAGSRKMLKSIANHEAVLKDTAKCDDLLAAIRTHFPEVPEYHESAQAGADMQQHVHDAHNAQVLANDPGESNCWEVRLWTACA